MSQSAAQINDETKEFLSFVLGDEHYALDITTVKEIRGYEQVTRVANAPPYIKGVINLRGDIVPIIDLRIKFNVGEPTYNEFTIVIMLTIEGRILGIVVDGVSDVVCLSDDAILPPPEFGVTFDSKYLHGLADVNGEMVILVNILALVTSTELGLVDSASSGTEE